MRDPIEEDEAMKRVFGVAGLMLTLVAAVPDSAWANPQHERMRQCNAQAREQALKGDARKAFMSTCLRGQKDAINGGEEEAGEREKALAPVGEAPTQTGASLAAPDEKTRRKACNQTATERSLKGAERKAFMAECVKV